MNINEFPQDGKQNLFFPEHLANRILHPKPSFFPRTLKDSINKEISCYLEALIKVVNTRNAPENIEKSKESLMFIMDVGKRVPEIPSFDRDDYIASHQESLNIVGELLSEESDCFKHASNLIVN